MILYITLRGIEVMLMLQQLTMSSLNVRYEIYLRMELRYKIKVCLQPVLLCQQYNYVSMCA